MNRHPLLHAIRNKQISQMILFFLFYNVEFQIFSWTAHRKNNFVKFI